MNIFTGSSPVVHKPAGIREQTGGCFLGNNYTRPTVRLRVLNLSRSVRSSCTLFVYALAPLRALELRGEGRRGGAAGAGGFAVAFVGDMTRGECEYWIVACLLNPAALSWRA